MRNLTTIEGPGPLNPISGPIDWTKPVETVNGQKVHIYAIDHNIPQPVIGRIGNDEDVVQWSYAGVYHRNGDPGTLDLRNVKEEK